MGIRARLLAPFVLAWIASASAQVTVAPSAIDFGERAQNGEFSAKATVTNRSPSPLQIVSVQGSCSCTTGEVADTKLAPGQSTELTIRMESRMVEGTVSHELTLEFSGGGSVSVPVKMTVSHYPGWIVAPPRLVFPPTGRRGSSQVTLHLQFLREGSPGPISAACDSPWVKIDPQPSQGRLFAFSVTKLAGAPAGSLYSELKITTGPAGMGPISIPVFAYTSSTLKVRPNPIVLHLAGAQAVAVAEISGWDGVNALRAEFDGGTAEIRELPGGNGSITLTLSGGAVPGSRKQLKLFDGQVPVLSVPVLVQNAP